MTTYTLELLHIADQEAAAAAITDAPNLSAVLNALRAQDLGADGVADNTLTLSSGDAFIPSLFFDASETAFGSVGIADIEIQNQLGIQAIALGNHEFDFGTGTLAGLIDGSAEGTILGADFTGAAFPYLSANLDVSTDANLAPLVVAGGQAPQPNAVTTSTVISLPGTDAAEKIGVIGATTPTLDFISSPGDVTIAPDAFDATPSDAQLDALAAEIQAEVDALLAANPDMNKVIVLSHMQQIGIEAALAGRLTDVDIIVAGGSNTRLLDETDRLRDGDSLQGAYPIIVDNAGGTQTAVVNTDGSYKYVGRLVIDFDGDGNIIPDSYDPAVSGAYATDAQGVADLGAAGLIDPEIQAIVDEIEKVIVETESNVFGVSDVFLNGNRSGADTAADLDGVRTQETNLGSLTADANLAMAQAADDTVMVSIKNGGGIRANIGQTVVPAGGTEAIRTVNEAFTDANGTVVKPEGGISQNDIATTLAFNNGLSLMTLTKQELVDVLEHGVSALPGVAGAFPQVAGIRFSFDPDLPAGNRIVSAAIYDGDTPVMELVRDGALVGDADTPVRIVTLSFLAGGGDGYPFPQGPEANRVDLYAGETDATRSGDATFANDGTEQDALAEYLDDNFRDTSFAMADTDRTEDMRIQNLNFREDSVLPATASNVILGTDGNDRLVGTDGDDRLVSLGGAFDRMRGDGGADTFFFGADMLDGVKTKDVVLDYEIGVDTLAFAPELEIASIKERATGLVITLQGDGDRIIVNNSALTAQTLDLGQGSETSTDVNLVLGSSDSDRLIGTNGNDRIVSGSGSFDRMRGRDGADQFVFGDEAADGVRDRDVILDYQAGLDAIVFENAVEIRDMQQRENGVSIYLAEDNDTIYVRGDDVTLDNITLINGLFDDIA